MPLKNSFPSPEFAANAKVIQAACIQQRNPQRHAGPALSRSSTASSVDSTSSTRTHGDVTCESAPVRVLVPVRLIGYEPAEPSPCTGAGHGGLVYVRVRRSTWVHLRLGLGSRHAVSDLTRSARQVAWVVCRRRPRRPEEYTGARELARTGYAAAAAVRVRGAASAEVNLRGCRVTVCLFVPRARRGRRTLRPAARAFHSSIGSGAANVAPANMTPSPRGDPTATCECRRRLAGSRRDPPSTDSRSATPVVTPARAAAGIRVVSGRGSEPSVFGRQRWGRGPRVLCLSTLLA
jgi:hypothetical protein